MAIYDITDFSDIISMVMEEMKYQSTDTVSKNRIKRDINAIYLNEVIPLKRWGWLAGHTAVQVKGYYNAGTAAVTPESTTVTLSVAPAVGTGSRAGFFFSVDGQDEIYVIDTHTAGATTVVLKSAFTGALNATATYKIWSDTVALPTDCKETVEIWQDFGNQTMEALGLQEFRRRVRVSPKSTSRPHYYTTYDYSGTTEAARYRQLKVHPSLQADTITLHVDYVQEASALEADGDEPVMPLEDRIVLVYGALSRAWARERNEEAAARNRNYFDQKLSQMMSKVEDSFDKPQLVPDNRYVSLKRGPRRRGVRSPFNGGGGGTYSSPTYITNATIATGNTLSGNLTVNAGITIDGVDISALSAEVDVLQALPSAQIFVGNASGVSTAVAVSGDISLSNAGVVAYTPLSIENGDVATAAAIARSKLGTGTADHVVINSGTGTFSSEATLAKTRGGCAADMSSVTFPSSGTIQTKVASTTDNALVRFDGTTGAQQNSTVTLGDTGAISNTLTGNVVALRLQTAVGNTADPFQIFYEDGSTNLLKSTYGGKIYSNLGFWTNNEAGFDSGGFTNSVYFTGQYWLSGAANPGTRFTPLNDTTEFLTTVQIDAGKATTIAQILKAYTSQTANIKQTRNVGGTVLNYEAANGGIQADAGFGAKRTTTATSYTVLVTDYFVGVTSNAAARTMTLPAASACRAGQVFIIKDEAGTAASANNITIARAGSDTIDGATSVTISANYGVIRLYSDGSGAYFSF